MLNNIRELRKAKGWSIRDLADRADTHFTTIAKIERSERRLTLDWVIRLARALDVDPSEVRGGPEHGKVQFKTVPLIGLISAGNWREAVQEAEEYVPSIAGGPQSFALRVDGDSMDLVAPKGTIVIVDPDQFELRDGLYFAVMNGDGETTFKQYRAEPPRLQPCSSNPEHQPIVLGQAHFTVIGRIVGQLSIM